MSTRDDGPEPRRQDDPQQRRQTPKVLVVDDSEEVRDLLVVNLELEGFEVRSAGDGHAGVDIARAWLPDVVTLDVVMPQLDGFAALQALREDPRTASLPVVLVTGRAQAADRARGESLGADGYLAKPFEPSELVAVVGRLARGGRA